MSKLLLLVFAVLLTTLLSSLVSAAAPQILFHGNVTFDIQPIPTWYRRIRVTFTGSNFTKSTRFRLSNTSNCGNGGLNAITDTLSSVESWTDFDSKSFFVASFIATGEAAVAYACVSYDKGRHYYMAKNAAGRYNFRLWGKVPTVKVDPRTPIMSAPLRLNIGNLPSGSKAVLVKDKDGCNTAVPTQVVDGGNESFVNFRDATLSYVDFFPLESSSKTYVCVATPPSLTDWTLAPVDELDEIIYRGWNYNNIPAPSDMVTGRITSAFFIIYPNNNQWITNYIGCNSPLVQGKQTRCYIWIENTTALNIVAGDFGFMSLTDGAGVAECPLPLFFQENVTHVYFDWVPQRWGREGKLSVMYQSNPIKMAFSTIAASSMGYSLPNTTHYSDKDVNETVITRFLVLPPDTFSVDYATVPNLLTDINAFTGLSPNFRVTRGIPDATSNSSSLGGEGLYATLVPSATNGVITKTISGIASASKCKLRVDYAFFPDTDFPDQTQTSLVGRASLISRDSTPADITTLKTYYLYVQGQSIIVTGADVKPLAVTGDIKMTESLTFETRWNNQQNGFRVELEIFHNSQRRFYWSEPEFKCLPASAGGPTLASDIVALKNFYTAVGGNGKWRLTNSWRNAANTDFNGDPCLNGWTGVICRNQRVTELHLDGIGLDGSVPTDLGDLTFLEVLRLGHNEFVGALPANLNNLVRLRMFDIHGNQFRSVPASFASSTTNLCLKRFFAQRNFIDAFPTQTIDSPVLESLRLEWNQMTGPIPNYTNPTVPLRELSVAHNKLTGYVPQGLPFTTLIVLDLSDNDFEGPVPNNWQQFQNIQYLDVSHNRLSQGIPFELAMIRSGPTLTFRAQDNYIGGVVPRMPFESLDLRQNIINCPEPQDEQFINEFHIKGLLYDECDYSGWRQLDYSPYSN